MKEMDSKSLPWVTPVAVGTDGVGFPSPSLRKEANQRWFRSLMFRASSTNYRCEYCSSSPALSLHRGRWIHLTRIRLKSPQLDEPQAFPDKPQQVAEESRAPLDEPCVVLDDPQALPDEAWTGGPAPAVSVFLLEEPHPPPPE